MRKCSPSQNCTQIVNYISYLHWSYISIGGESHQTGHRIRHTIPRARVPRSAIQVNRAIATYIRMPRAANRMGM